MRCLIAVVLVASLFLAPAESELLDTTFTLDVDSPWLINNVVTDAIVFNPSGDGVDLTAHGYVAPSTISQQFELDSELDQVVFINYYELNGITTFNGIVYLALYGGSSTRGAPVELARVELFSGEQTVKFRIRFGTSGAVLGAALVGPAGAKIRITEFRTGVSTSGSPLLEMDTDSEQYVFPPSESIFWGGQVAGSSIDGDRRTCHTTTHGAYASGYEAALSTQSYCCLRKGRVSLNDGAKCRIGGCLGIHCHEKQSFLVSSEASIAEGELCYADCLERQTFANNEYEYKLFNTPVAMYDINFGGSDDFATEMNGVGLWSNSYKACHAHSENAECCQLKGKINQNGFCQFTDCAGTECGPEYSGFYTRWGETPAVGDTCLAKCWTMEYDP